MVTILIALWAFALLLLFTDPNQTSTRWASATAFVGGLGFFSEVMETSVYPLVRAHALQHPQLDHAILFLVMFASFLCQTGLPYCFLMFAVHSCDFLSRRTRRIIQYAALLPPAVMLAITPIYPVLSFHYGIMISWVIPYFVCACLLLIYLYKIEKDPVVKRSRLVNNILVIVPLLFIFTFLYIMRTFHNYDAWRYNALIVGIQFVLFLFISVKYGLLGVKLRLEKRRLDSTLRAMTSGTAIVNHTIKNEVGKITLYADRIQSYAAEEKKQAMQEDMQVILQSTRNIMAMVNRIQGQIQDIVLKEEPVHMAGIVERVLQEMKPYTETQQIAVKLDLDDSIKLKGDPVHIREVLTNLCMNAVEAMRTGGTLTIQLMRSRKHLVLSVADTGTGISKENLPYVLDPFFSTKKGGQNFGLGLSYCYNVMQKHQGRLEIQSVKDEGTTVFLYFPQKRLIL
ncbi:HAMP domain-containing histidine kinase [Brevibacillus sp. SYP-B805]|uniref:sensor histidine kinase n=1 Tax=Brevibacillus sp. SYP-B805 TaxID=1578199 RepID=UPI0013ED4BD5|nr:HAMP domain-containing sensor histidine kinase [Brevibacillus sp. SYP-B805]NGQ96169.1 HAMP domain-containing histidine kinase [Brevibacillus sp. SYP-B805]